MPQQGTVTGLGGVFLRVADPEALYAWYEEHLGLSRHEGTFIFPASEKANSAVLALFDKENGYWPQKQPAMINLQVDDVDAILDRLIAAGVVVDAKRESYPYGRFGWFTDPEGNRVELWQTA